MPSRPFAPDDVVPARLRTGVPEAATWPEAIGAAVPEGLAALLDLGRGRAMTRSTFELRLLPGDAAALDVGDALVAALAAGARRLRLPAGTLRLGRAVMLPAGTTIEGMGGGLGAPATEIVASAAGALLVSAAYDVTIRDLTLRGPGAGVGIGLAAAARCRLEGVGVSGFDTGVAVGADCQQIEVDHCTLDARLNALRIDQGASHVQVVASRLGSAREATIRDDGESTVVLCCELRSSGPTAFAVGPAGRHAAVRYNHIVGPSTAAIVTDAASETESGAHVFDLNHLDGDTLTGVADDEDTAHGPARAVAARSGESAWNLLVNGSFEWPAVDVAGDAGGRFVAGLPTRWVLSGDAGRVLVGRRIFTTSLDTDMATIGQLPPGLPIPTEASEACGGRRSIGPLPLATAPAASPPTLGDYPLSLARPTARDGAACLHVVQREFAPTSRPGTKPGPVIISGRIARGLGRAVTADRATTFSMFGRLLRGQGTAWLRLSWDGGQVESPPLRPTPALALAGTGTWERLVCRAAVDPEEPSLTAAIVVQLAVKGGPTEVLFDGGQVNAGWHVMEPGDTPVTERGGYILGPVTFDCGAAPAIALAAPANVTDAGVGVADLRAPFDGQLLAVDQPDRPTRGVDTITKDASGAWRPLSLPAPVARGQAIQAIVTGVNEVVRVRFHLAPTAMGGPDGR